MEHSAHLVDLLDQQGKVVGSKPRNEVQKSVDIYHSVHILLVTPRGEVILATIPVREDLPNLYAQKMSTTAATIRRHDETAATAADRCMIRELFIDDMPLTLLGERMYRLPHDRQGLMSLYYGIADAPESYSLLDIASLIVLTPRDIDLIIERHPMNLADSFMALWQDYRHKLPI